MFKYFVWISGLRGPEAQIWADADCTVNGKPVLHYQQVRLSADDPRTLDQLKLDYPFEAKP